MEHTGIDEEKVIYRKSTQYDSEAFAWFVKLTNDEESFNEGKRLAEKLGVLQFYHIAEILDEHVWNQKGPSCVTDSYLCIRRGDHEDYIEVEIVVCQKDKK